MRAFWHTKKGEGNTHPDFDDLERAASGLVRDVLDDALELDAPRHRVAVVGGSSAGAGLLRANRPIAVEQFDPEAGLTIETFPSLSAAGNALGISPSSISKILAGKIGYKTAKGFGIRKADEAVAANGNHPNPPTLNP